MGWHVKQRIIAKAVRSASFGQNTPFPGTLTDQRHRISRMSQIDNDALKSGRAFCFFNMLKGFQEFCIVCFISPIADDSGISGRVDSGVTVQRVYLNTRIVSNTGQPGYLAGMPCLDNCIFDEAQPGLLCIGHTEFGLRQQGYIFLMQYFL